MKKLISLLVIFSIIFSMGMITVNADALGNFVTMDSLTTSSGLPGGWTKAGQTDERTVKIGNLTDTDKVLILSNMNNSDGTLFSIYNKERNLSSNDRRIHVTAMLSALETNFTKIGLKLNKARLAVDGKEASSDVILSNSDLVMFEKQSDGTISLTSWGETVQENFPFETNKMYKLDCIILGQSNKMELYIDNVWYKTVDYSSIIKNSAGDATSYYMSKAVNFILTINTSTLNDTFLADNVGEILYYNSFTQPAFSTPNESTLEIAEDDNYIAENKTITLSTDASITVDTLLENISGIKPSSQLVVIGSDGLYKTGTENVTKGDKVVEVIPVSATTDNKGKTIITDEKITVTQFTVKKEEVNCVNVERKNTIDNATWDSSWTGSPTDTLSTPIKTLNNHSMGFWQLDNKDYTINKESGLFGKAEDDYALKLSVKDKSPADAYFLLSASGNMIVNTGAYLHVSAEIAAEEEKFNNLGITARFTDIGDFKVFSFAKDENNNNNVILTSFGDKISGTDSFVFKTNQFYKIDLLFDCKDTKVKIYLNGEYLDEKDYAEKIEDKTVTKLSHIFFNCGYTEHSYWYCDNMYVDKYTQGMPSFLKRTAEATLSDDYKANYNNGAVYLASHGATVEKVLRNFNTTKTLAVFDRDYNVLKSTDCITNGAKIVETAKDGETLHYTEIRMPYDCITLTQTSKEEDGVTTYTVNASSLFANSGEKAEYMLLIAQYGENSLENAELVHIDLTEGYGEEFIKEVNLTSTTDPTENIKAFIWGEDGLKPLEIKVQ